MTIAFFHEQGFFNGELPRDLVRDFVGGNYHTSLLEARVQFGVRYRFVSGNTVEETEATLALPVRAGLTLVA